MQNKSLILNFVLAIAVVVLGVRLVSGVAQAKESVTDEQAVLDNIATRTSIRDYDSKPVEKEKVEKMLRAAMSAPTAMNRQPWHFIVVDRRSVLDALSEANPYAKMLRKAPLAVVVCGDMDKAIEGKGRDFWIQDASAATENLLLAAHAMGLGAVWTGCYPSEERVEGVRKILSLPDNIIPLNVVVMGYPAENPQPKDKFKTENISYNTYGETQDADLSEASADAVTQEKKQKDAAGGLKEFDITAGFKDNPFTWFRGHGLVLCAGDRKAANAMTIGWGALGTLWSKPTATVYVRSDRYTHRFMEQSPYFTIMKFDDNDIPDYMGRHSGRDGDKAKALGLHLAYTRNGTPYYREASLVIECRTMYSHPFVRTGFRDDVPRDFYANPETNGNVHTEYVGEIVGAMKR